MRIGIVDTHPAADTLRRAVLLMPEHRVIWIATTDVEVTERCTAENPDLILMNVHMTEMDGVEATRRIMAQAPCAILVVTAGTHLDPGRVFEAVGHGALDTVDVPGLDIGDLRERAAPLLAKITTISRRLSNRNRVKTSGDRGNHEVSGSTCNQLVAIGASAGGPAAIATLLSGLPMDFPAAIVIVQHVDERFTESITDWLRHHTSLPVSVAREGDRPREGRVLVAGTGGHLALKAADRLGYTAQPRQYAYRPSVDVFFQSVSREWLGDVIGVLLTGMGRDGAVGLKALRDRGHHTIAQDEATSAVYGMPKAAAALKAAVETLPIERIAARLIKVLASKSAQVAK